MRLIDAEALKKALDEQMNFEENCRDSVFDIIDNAPTVEPSDYVVAERAEARQRGYADGYRNGMEIGKTLNPKIKQGEWKRDNYGDVFCSNCGVECAYNEEGLYSLGLFCHHCGADMRKGDES